MAEVLDEGLPEPESDDLGRYLEDTITIDWQTPTIMQRSKTLLEGLTEPEERVTALFEFVRDEIDHSIDNARGLDPMVTTCSASQVLKEGTGLCYAKSHLLAAFLRVAGFPTGFCYVRLVSGQREDKFVLHGFNGVYWKPTSSWIFLDPRGNRAAEGDEPALEAEARFAPPFSMPWAPDAECGEAFLPFIYRRPAKRIVDLLERAPDFAAVRRNLPDAL